MSEQHIEADELWNLIEQYGELRRKSRLGEGWAMRDAIKAHIARLYKRIEDLENEVKVDDQLISERDRLLNLFECPMHGQCVPYAIEEVTRLRELEASLVKDEP